MASTRTTQVSRTNQLEGGDQADHAATVVERQLEAQIAAQRCGLVLWTVRLVDGTFLQPEEPMTLSELFGELEEKRGVDIAADLEAAAYYDSDRDTVIVARPRGGTCDEALRAEVLSRHRRSSSN